MLRVRLRFYEGRWEYIKKVIITIILFAVSIALILGVILPIARHGKATGNSAYQRGKQIGNSIQNISQ